MKHPLNVPKYDGTLEELAHDVANLRYDALESFLGHLAAEIGQQEVSDAGRGRKQLATVLGFLTSSLETAQGDAQIAWAISKPHMGP